MKLPSVSALLLVLSVQGAIGLDLYVAPNGSDSWTGKLSQPDTAAQDGPLQTLQGARDTLRLLRKSVPLHEPVQIILADGEYPIAPAPLPPPGVGPLVFEPEDGGTKENPVTYEAAPGAHVVITGGFAIPKFDEVEGGLWRA